MTPEKVIFVYPVTKPYSGQTVATLIAMDELKKLGWRCVPVGFSGLDRSVPKYLGFLLYVLSTCNALIRLLVCLLPSKAPICFNHPQSLISFMRMGIPHLVIRYLMPHRRIITSVHGNQFMNWDQESLKMRFYIKILHASHLITVLGEKQRNHIAKLNVPLEKIKILSNCCESQPLEIDQVKAKHSSLARHPDKPLVILHLSLLIESKGFPEFLNACTLFAKDVCDRPVTVVLCGPLTSTSDGENFENLEVKSAWIKEKIASLNKIENVTATWIPGATGVEKSYLFNEAHCFVLPTRYPVEVQPLVLLEAMAAGCYIITSDQGEIPTTLASNAGLSLGDVSPDKLAQEIGKMSVDHFLRLETALAARQLCVSKYSRATYAKNWDTILR